MMCDVRLKLTQVLPSVFVSSEITVSLVERDNDLQGNVLSLDFSASNQYLIRSANVSSLFLGPGYPHS